jgi:hypothetical protein
MTKPLPADHLPICGAILAQAVTTTTFQGDLSRFIFGWVERYQEPGRISMPIASDDAKTVDVASRLIREVGYEPVLIGGLEKGKYLMPGTALAGERSAEEIRKIAAGLK